MSEQTTLKKQLNDLRKLKVAFVHDYLVKLGGAEKVLDELLELFPDAPVYTLLYSEKGTNSRYKNRRIITSFLQRLPGAVSHLDRYRALMPAAIEQLDFNNFDLVVSNNHSFSKGIIVKPDTLHITYCHTPTRYLWHQAGEGKERLGWLGRKLYGYGASYLRVWDALAARRPDAWLANSKNVQARIKKYYRQTSTVLYPPVDVARFKPGKNVEIQDYFIHIGRLEPHKRVDIAVEACTKLGGRLVIVGDGTDLPRLKRLAGPTVEFKGRLADDETLAVLQKARAFIFPQEEDFGITLIEALAAGKPVIAYGAGSAPELLQEGKTGLLFRKQSALSLQNALQSFHRSNFRAADCVAAAQQFSNSNFRANFIKEVYAIVKKQA